MLPDSVPALPPTAAGPVDLPCLQARAQAYEEAVSLALFAAAWLQHSARDPRASAGARQVARLLAASAGRQEVHGPNAFVEARQVLEAGLRQAG